MCVKGDIIQTWLGVDAETNVMWGIAVVMVVVVMVVMVAVVAVLLMMMVAPDRNYGRWMLLSLPIVLMWIDC